MESRSYPGLRLTAGICLLLVVIIFAPGCGGNSASNTTTAGRDSGLGIDTVIRVGSIGEELDVMNGTVCGGDGFFRKTQVEVVVKDGRHYDVVDASCTAGGEVRKFYFDVSSCFPCPD